MCMYVCRPNILTLTNPMQTNHPQNPTTVTPPPLPPSGGGDSKASDGEFWKSYPLGYRFRPTDKEIIIEYLMKKINNEELPPSMIHTVKLYAFSPDQLSEMFRPSGVKEWYFFTPRDKKYKNGRRPNRAAGDGHWNPIDTNKHIMHDGEIIGSRRLLAYNKGTPKNCVKTDWLMHEFTVRNSSTTQVNTMRLDDWVLCKVYKSTQKKTRIPSKRKHSKEVKDGEAKLNNIEAIELSVESSYASSGPSSSSPSSVDVSPLTFPYNLARLGLQSRPSFDTTNLDQNRVGSSRNTININEAAMQPHVASSYPIPTASVSSRGVSQSYSLPFHHGQQVSSFASLINKRDDNSFR